MRRSPCINNLKVIRTGRSRQARRDKFDNKIAINGRGNYLDNDKKILILNKKERPAGLSFFSGYGPYFFPSLNPSIRGESSSLTMAVDTGGDDLPDVFICG